MNVKIRKTCRLCGERSLTPVLDLGPQLLATSFVSKDNKDFVPTRKVPLRLMRCNTSVSEKACGLVQLEHTYPAELMYAEYFYLSGVNSTMRNALRDITKSAEGKVQLEAGDTVVDIGCNDGTLLESYAAAGIDKVGIDPARNIAKIKTDWPFTRVVDFFSADAFKSVRPNKKAKIITSIAMFYDLEDPNSFVADIASILDNDGLWIVQMADLPEMLKQNMFDNICHEHLCYYHIAPFEYLLHRHGLVLQDIEKNDINGSSYRFYVTKKNSKLLFDEAAARRVTKQKHDEFNMCLDEDATYEAFDQRIQENKNKLVNFLHEQKRKNKNVFIYGASTKGNVLLQYFGITKDLVPYAADRNERKWGLNIIGSDIPIISEEEARKMAPDYLLVLPYHFLPEMIKREDEYIKRGGKFIVPVPDVHLAPTL